MTTPAAPGPHTAALGAVRADPTESAAMCARLGLSGFGLAAARLDAASVAKIAAAAAAEAVTVNCLAHGIRTEPGPTSAWAGERDALTAAIDRAAELGSPTVLITSGPSGELPWEAAADRLAEHLAETVAYARRAGVTVAVENTMTMRAELSFTHRVADAAAVAGMMDAGVVVDLYSAWQERDLAATLARHRDRVALVQLADLRMPIHSVPNRWALGEGDLPLTTLTGMLAELGLAGSIDLELLGPAIDAEGIETALRRSLDWLADHRIGDDP